VIELKAIRTKIEICQGRMGGGGKPGEGLEGVTGWSSTVSSLKRRNWPVPA